MTVLGGLPAYLDLAQVAGFRSSVEHHVRLREGGQGWSDSQVISSLVLLNLAGGESVDDLRILEKGKGFCKVLGRVETRGMRRRERRATERSGERSDDVVCRRPRRCFATLWGSTTRDRRKGGFLTPLSYLLPTKRWRDWGKLTAI